jgi:hypothetical protein
VPTIESFTVSPRLGIDPPSDEVLVVVRNRSRAHVRIARNPSGPAPRLA